MCFLASCDALSLIGAFAQFDYTNKFLSFNALTNFSIVQIIAELRI